MDHKLILDLIKRIEDLRISTTPVLGAEQLIAQHEDSLVRLTAERHNAVMFGLANYLDRTRGINYTVETMNLVLKTQLAILKLIQRCADAQWKRARAQIEEPFATVDPPALDAELAQFLLQQVGQYILSTHPVEDEELRRVSGEILLHLSASNFEVVFARIKAKINALAAQQSDKDEETSDLQLLEYLNLNENRLSQLFLELSRSIRRFGKKSQVIIAHTLRKAIWNWIDCYPMEFVNVCRSAQKMRGNPDVLFDVFAELADNNKKKASFWPVQTMLLVLCPDIFLQVGSVKNKDDEKANARVSNKAKFLKDLEKGLQVKALSDVAAISYVDLCKASTYVAITDFSALRYQIPTVERELKAKLFDVKKFEDSPENLQLMIDSLVSFFRLNAKRSLNEEFQKCYAESSPPQFKLAMIYALHQMATEPNPLPWNETINTAYAEVSAPLRKMFRDYLTRYQANKGADLKKKDMAARDVDATIIRGLIDLFRVHPMLFIYNSSTHTLTVKSDSGQLLATLVELIEPNSDPYVFKRAVEGLLKVHAPEYIKQWCTVDVYNGFWEISSSLFMALGQRLLSIREFLSIESTRVQGEILTLLTDLQSCRLAFLRDNREGVADASAASVDAWMNSSCFLEAALIVAMSSSEVSTIRTALQCMGLFCDEIEFLNSAALGRFDMSRTMAINYHIYRPLSALGKKVMGREFLQREIRKGLRRMENSTRGNVMAWNEMMVRWADKLDLVQQFEAQLDGIDPPASAAASSSSRSRPGERGRTAAVALARFRRPVAETAKEPAVPAEERKPHEDIRAEWMSYVGSLSALGAVKLGASVSLSDDPNVTNVDEFKYFLQIFQDLLVSDAKFIRENTLKTVAPSLSPAAYPATFGNFGAKMAEFLKAASGNVIKSTENSLAVEQFIDVVRRVLDVPQESEDELTLVDFETLLSSFVEYASGLVSLELDTTRMRYRSSNLILLFMEKKHLTTLRDEAAFRNRLVAHLLTWVTNAEPEVPGEKASSSSGGGASTDEASSNKDKEKEKDDLMNLDLAAMKAVDALTNHLAMVPIDPADRNNNHAKTDMFVRNFAFFNAKLATYRKFISLAPNEAAAAKHIELADLATNCLANLLSANIDLGFEYFVTQGYSSDLETRTAFIKVLTNILKQGTEFDALADSSAPEQYGILLRLMLESDLTVVEAIINSVPGTDTDRVASVLVRLFSAGGQVIPLLQRIIETEVANTQTQSTLFRRNSLATKFLASYTKELGRGYLREVLEAPLQAIVDSTANFEVDPARLPEGADTGPAAVNVLREMNNIFEAIINAKATCPQPILYICGLLARTVGAKFADASRTAVAGFIFLRFFCPAIVAPDGFGVLSENVTSAAARRALVLFTKILQNLANGVAFGSKELYMNFAAPFMDQNMARMHKYLDEMGLGCAVPKEVVPAEIHLEDQILEDVQEIHRQIVLNQDQIFKHIALASAPAEADGGGGGGAASSSSALNASTSGALSMANQRYSVAPDLLVDSMLGEKAASSSSSSDTPPALPRRGGVSGPSTATATSATTAAAGAGAEGGSPSASAPVAAAAAGAENSKAAAPTVFDESSAHTRLKHVLASLGAPPERAARVTEARNADGDTGVEITVARGGYRKFMADNRNLNTDRAKASNVFYRHGVSRKGFPVFYLNARKINDSLRTEMQYYILSLLDPHLGSPWDLVVDLSLFSSANEVESLSSITKNLPANGDAQLNQVILLNPNRAFKKWTKSTSVKSLLTGIKKFVFVNNLDGLGEYIAPAELKLLPDTMTLYTDIKAQFIKTIESLDTKNPETELSFFITSEYLVIETPPKSHTLLGSRVVSFRDIYYVKNIEKLVSEKNKFTIQISDGGKLQFSSHQSEQILHALKLSIAGLGVTGDDMRKFRPEDVPGTLLNMALLNMGSDHAPLRLAAYDLLYTLCISFNFVTKDELVWSPGLYIPENTAGFVVNISQKLAAAEVALSLEFLRESLASFNSESNNRKHLCLQYMSSWLPNLAVFCNPSPAEDFLEKFDRVREIVSTLITLTLNEPDIYPSVQNLVWGKIGRVPEILPIVLDGLITRAVELGYMSKGAEVITDTVITVGSASPSIVGGRVIGRLLKTIRATSEGDVKNLADHALWPEICVLSRFVLKLSFHNHIDLHHFLPELLHIVMCLLSTGSPEMRATIHAVMINIMQSLCVDSDTFPPEVTHALSFRLRDLAGARFKFLFGVGSKKLAFQQKVQGVEDVAVMLYDILVCCQSTDQTSLGLEWLARWQSLTVAAAFSPNTALRSRLFITLGVVIQHHCNDGTIAEVLRQFHNVMVNLHKTLDYELAMALMMALARFVSTMPRESKFFDVMFWLAVSVLEIGQIDLLPPALTLLEITLKNMEAHHCFDGTVFNLYQLNARLPVASICMEIDALSGLSFDQNFSFALTGVLLRGLKHSSTKALTQRVLASLLNVAGKGGIDPNVLGYLATLIVVHRGDISQLPIPLNATAETEGSLQIRDFTFLFTKDLLPNTNSELLLLTLLATLLDASEYEVDQHFIYTLLSQAAEALPAVFPVTYDILIARMSSVLIKSQNSQVISRVEDIMFSMVRQPPTSTPPTLQALGEFGFHGLASSFTDYEKDSARRLEIMKLTASVIGALVSLY